jgi:sugar O-acyltransferase (sialic acid O-acetyltransferase NeuD family)
MEDILLIGGGGHCKAVIDVIELEKKYRIAGIIDKKSAVGDKVFDYDVIGCDDDLENLYKVYKYAIVTVGHIRSSSVRVRLFQMLKTIGYTPPTIISPLAYVSKYAHIAEGSVVMHHALVNASALIGKNSIVNSKSLIEHDSIIEDHCHISTGAIINGGTVVKKGSFVGSNAVSKEAIDVKGFVKAGSVVK